MRQFPRHPHAPLSAAVARERMQPQPWAVHVARASGLVEHGQKGADAGHEVRRQPAWVVVLGEFPEPFVADAHPAAM